MTLFHFNSWDGESGEKGRISKNEADSLLPELFRRAQRTTTSIRESATLRGPAVFDQRLEYYPKVPKFNATRGAVGRTTYEAVDAGFSYGQGWEGDEMMAEMSIMSNRWETLAPEAANGHSPAILNAQETAALTQSFPGSTDDNVQYLLDMGLADDPCYESIENLLCLRSREASVLGNEMRGYILHYG